MSHTDKVRIDGFDWDSSNEFKNKEKRDISKEKIEEFFRSKIRVGPDIRHSQKEDRFIAIGRGPDGKPMFVAFTFRIQDGLKLIRPISARFMHAKEIQKYEKTFTKDKK